MSKPSKTQAELRQENAELRARLEEAEATLRAFRSGAEDTQSLRTPAPACLDEDLPYRSFVETMNEGATILGNDGRILYCSRRLAVTFAAIRLTNSCSACLTAASSR
jgi:PAS domain-containing protein